jgi:hypothetical protein
MDFDGLEGREIEIKKEVSKQRRPAPSPDMATNLQMRATKRILSGIKTVGIEEKLKTSATSPKFDPSPSARQRRFEKFRSRRKSESSDSPFLPSTPVPSSDSKSIPTTNSLPAFQRNSLEGSPMKPIFLDEEDGDVIHQRSSLSSSTLMRSTSSNHEVSSKIPRSTPLLRRKNETSRLPTLEVITTPSALELSTTMSSSSSLRDRIEESRDTVEDTDSKTEIDRIEVEKDQIEVTRKLSPTHGSLGIPSLRSSCSTSQTSGRRSLDASSRSTSSRASRHETASRHRLPQTTIEKSGVDRYAVKYHADAPSMYTHDSRGSSSTPRSQRSDRITLSREEPSQPATESQTARPILDQRTVRLLYSVEFSSIIERNRRGEISLDTCTEKNSASLLHEGSGVSFVVRKQPISEHELEGGDFDVVAINSNQHRGHECVIVYQTQIQSDLKTKQVKPISFPCDTVLSADCNAEEFYLRIAHPLVLMAKNGGISTILMFGQPGSAKTYTLIDIEERAVRDIFEHLKSPGRVKASRACSVTVQYVELIGDQCHDLLGEAEQPVQVVEKEGGFRFKGAGSKTAMCSRELLQIISNARERRSSQQRAHPNGPSHAICQLCIRQEGRQGCLILLDCSETEKNEGNNSFYSDRHQQSTETDSLQALKECIRARARARAYSSPQRNLDLKIACRSNNLTKILQESFEKEDSRLCMVATVRANATVTEQTLRTLETLSNMMSGADSGYEESRDAGVRELRPSQESPNREMASPRDGSSPGTEVLPRQWSRSDLIQWMERKHLLGNPLHPDMNGRFAMRMSKLQLKNTFYDVFDDSKAEKLFTSLRAENDRVARIRVKNRLARERRYS